MLKMPHTSQSLDTLATITPSGHHCEFPLVSVVVPVLNEKEHLGLLLDDLLAQEFPSDGYEIVVVDGGSRDGTPELVTAYQGRSRTPILLLSNLGRLSSAGRNLGVLNSRGEWIVFIDGHCRISSRRLLKDTVEVSQRTGADCLCRPQPLTLEGNTWFQDVVARVRATFLAHGRGSTIYLSNYEGNVEPTSSGATYRRSVFTRAGMYDEQFDACEDVEFNYRVYRAGLSAYFDSRLAVCYRPRASVPALLKQTIRYGRGRFRFMRKHPDAITFSQLAPALFLAALFVGTLASWCWPPLRSVLLSPLIAYGALVLSLSAWLAFHHGWRYLLAAPWAYLTIHCGFGAGLLFEGASFLLKRRPLRQAGAKACKQFDIS